MKRPTFEIERLFWRKNYEYVLGLDEVGRGAFAGPIVAAGVVFPQNKKITKNLSFLKEVNDSKILKANIRRKLAVEIKKHSLCYAIEEIDIKTINKLGIGRANKMVFRKVVNEICSKLNSKEIYLLVDGYPIKNIKYAGLKNQKGIIDGDQKSLSIAAASIIAKVHRDSLMKRLSKEYSNYKLSRNKGYGTPAHQKALRLYGLSKIHRTSFDLNKFLTQPI